MNLANN